MQTYDTYIFDLDGKIIYGRTTVMRHQPTHVITNWLELQKSLH